MMWMQELLGRLWDLTQDVAPWMVVGLMAAGVVKALAPEKRVARWLGRGVGSIGRAAVIGAPLPLCSCSVIPVAMGLHRQGASKPATVAFLVATPETGADSVAISWALLGPFLTIVRPVVAIVSAICAGLAVLWSESAVRVAPPKRDQSVAPPIAFVRVGGAIPIASKSLPISVAPTAAAASSCSDSACGCNANNAPDLSAPLFQRLWQGVVYAFDDIWNDLAPWLVGGLLISAIILTWTPPGAWAGLGDYGPLAMLLMIIASVPVYVCATASTPIAAAMIVSGVTPGMALAFMIAGPATNLATLGAVKRELGWRIMGAYLGAVIACAWAAGVLTDWLAPHAVAQLPLVASAGGAAPTLSPLWLNAAMTLLLGGLWARHGWRRWRASRAAFAG
ncbi:SO_0444 family Cu/Zn efflux transporter [Magnetofaba australis]|uniref:Putative membrane protein n=1 Tax=Magnetofaba australis IT-1 TaxID=1434232 RepID=A0A1Y2K1V0_9PROT|nr:SO_0444 family Cu/Zn efflux transporter [Magnetofaba australis]OSM02011.1 putative membrane protein [Magnetofaba australis IT-1]